MSEVTCIQAPAQDTGLGVGRDCSVHLVYPVQQLEEKLLQISADDFVSPTTTADTGRGRARMKLQDVKLCSICAKPCPASPASHTATAGLQSQVIAFKMFCVILNVPAPSTHLRDIKNGSKTFQCCETCSIDLEILDIAHTELLKKIEEFDGLSSQIMEMFLNVFLHKIYKPSATLSAYLREQQPQLLKRWRNRLIRAFFKTDKETVAIDQGSLSCGNILNTTRMRSKKLPLTEPANKFDVLSPHQFQDVKDELDDDTTEHPIPAEIELIAEQNTHPKLRTTKRVLGTVKSHRARKNSKKARRDDPSYPQECKLCGRRWKNEIALNSHMKSHQAKELCDSNVLTIAGKVIKKQTVGKYSFFVCDECGKKFNKKFEIREHLTTIHLEKNYIPCPICGRPQISQRHLRKHIAYRHNAPKCRFCDKKIVGVRLDLRKHEFMHHKEEYLSGEPYYCTVCLETFCKQSDLDSHFSAHDSCRCKICGYICQSDRGLKIHVRRHYVTYKSDVTKERSESQRPESSCASQAGVLCLLCHEKFADEDLTRLHYQKEHPRIATSFVGAMHGLSTDAINPNNSFKALICSYGCSGTFGTREELSKHYVTDHKNIYLRDKPFWCEICFSTFESEVQKKNHSLTHNKDPSKLATEPPVCTTCGKNFNKLANLKRHEKLHEAGMEAARRRARMKHIHPLKSPRRGWPTKFNSNLKVFCDHCGILLCGGRPARLHFAKAHREEYLRENPYLCEICVETYPTQAALDQHLDTSHFKCQFCDRKFYTNMKRLDHERVHTKEQPYICDECGRKFNTDSNYRMHKKLHTGERSMWCTICADKTVGFFRRRDLQKHMYKCHPNGVSTVPE